MPVLALLAAVVAAVAVAGGGGAPGTDAAAESQGLLVAGAAAVLLAVVVLVRRPPPLALVAAAGALLVPALAVAAQDVTSALVDSTGCGTLLRPSEAAPGPEAQECARLHLRRSLLVAGLAAPGLVVAGLALRRGPRSAPVLAALGLLVAAGAALTALVVAEERFATPGWGDAALPGLLGLLVVAALGAAAVAVRARSALLLALVGVALLVLPGRELVRDVAPEPAFASGSRYASSTCGSLTTPTFRPQDAARDVETARAVERCAPVLGRQRVRAGVGVGVAGLVLAAAPLLSRRREPVPV